MSKIRVYELAKELGIPSHDLISLLLAEFNIEVKNHMSVIEDEEATLIKELLIEKKKLKDEKPVTNEVVDIEEKYADLIVEDIKIKQIKKGKKKIDENEADPNETTVEDKALNYLSIQMDDTISVKELSEKLNKPITDVIKQLMFLGVMAGINQEIDYETAKKLGLKFEVNVSLKEKDSFKLEDNNDKLDDDDNTVKRAPVVTVMGHVDHGKTSLLDAIRKAKVTETEAGGITQHIGAYTVTIKGEKITFLDTPGHEAFTAMRARGAQITDIVILVVAAEDGLMPQTIEAINHCKAANVPIIVAINKIDKPGANPEKVKQELTEYGLVSEDWGGDTICVPVSARTHEGIESLLEMVLLTAEIEELKGNPTREAKGTVIESKLDKGRGAVATLLVQNGTLKVGDSISVGSTYGRIRAMFDDKGKKIKSAGPSIPVEILGLSEVPAAGDRFNVVKDEKTARDMSEVKKEKERSEYLHSTHKVSLEDLYSQIKEGKVKELELIIKADVQGSVGALKQSLENLSTDSIKVRVIHSGVGAITETDVILGAASSAIIIGFNVRPDNNGMALAEKDNVEIKTYSIIYNAIDDVKAAMIGMLDPIYKEVVQGRAEIRQIYKISNVGTIAGAYVLNGKITKSSSVRVLRNSVLIFESTFASLKRFKDDAKEVAAGFECGFSIDKYNDLREGDIVEAYTIEETKQLKL